MMLEREFGNEADDRQSRSYDRFRNYSSDVDFESRPRIISRRLAAARMYLNDILSELDALIQHLRVSPALRELQKLDMYASSKGQTWQRSRSRSPSQSPERWGRDWRWNDVRRRIDEASTQPLPSVASNSNSWRAEQRPPSFLQPPSRASSSLLRQREVPPDYGFAPRPSGLRSSDGRQEAPPSTNDAADDSNSSPSRANGSGAEYRESMVQDGDGSPPPRRSSLKSRQSSRVAFAPQTEIRQLSSDQFEEALDPPQEAERASSSMEDPQDSRKQSMAAASSSARKSSTDQLQDMPRRSSRESEAQPYSPYAAGTEASEWREGQDQFGTPINVVEPASTYYADGEFEGTAQAGGSNADLVQQSEADGSRAIVDNSGEIMSRKSVRQKWMGRRSKSDSRSGSFQAKESSSEGLSFDESEMLGADEQPEGDASAAAAIYGGSRKTMYAAGNGSSMQQLNPPYSQVEENPSRPRSGSSSSLQRTSYSNYAAEAESQGSANADLNPSRRSRLEQAKYQSALPGAPSAALADGRKSRLSAQGSSNVPMAMDGRGPDMEVDGENATNLPIPLPAAAAQGRKSRYQDGEARRSQVQGAAPQEASVDDAADGKRSQFMDFQGEDPSIPPAAVPATDGRNRSRRISNDGRKSRFVMGADGRMNGVAEDGVVYGDVAGRKSRFVETNDPSPPEYRGSGSNPSPGNAPRMSESRKSRINGKQAYERNSLQAAADESDETTIAQGRAMRKSQVRDPAMARSEGSTSRFMSSRDENPRAPFSFTEEVSGEGTMEQQDEGVGEADYDQVAMMEWESRFISRYAETDEAWMEMEGTSSTYSSAEIGQDSMGEAASSGYHGRGSRVGSILGIPSSDTQNAGQQDRRESATAAAAMARASVGDSRTRNQSSVSPPTTNSIGQSMRASGPEICIDVQSTQAIRPGISIEWWQ